MNALAKKVSLLGLTLVVLTVTRGPGRAQDVPAPAAPVSTSSNAVFETDPQVLKSLLLLQDQLRTTQRAVEQGREQAAADSKRAEEAMTARLSLVEQSLSAQRAQELASLQESTRTVITIASGITAVGFIIVLFAGFAQVRAMTRLAEVSRQLSAALPAIHVPEAPRAPLLPGGGSVEAANANLLDAITRLERRLEDMEAKVSDTETTTNGHKQIAPPAGNSQLATLLAKGQALLNLDKAEEALDHFDEALRLEPRNIEAWIKKGAALERLQRVDEAITAYDQAIAVDNSVATAYLFKAGVYNRQKKYAEALQCYEKALGAQQKSRAQAARA